jgi:hypothetical protein
MLLKSIKARQAEDILINSATLVSFAQQAEYATDHVVTSKLGDGRAIAWQFCRMASQNSRPKLTRV